MKPEDFHTHHEFGPEDPRRAKWCVPAALSAATGITAEKFREAINVIRDEDDVTKQTGWVHGWEETSALDLLGVEYEVTSFHEMDYEKGIEYRDYWGDVRHRVKNLSPTINQFSKALLPGDVAVVAFSRHLIAVICDADGVVHVADNLWGGRRASMPLKDFPQKRKRVGRVIQILSVPEAEKFQGAPS